MSNTTKQPVISAVFQDRYDAIEAHSFVKSMGYADSEINVLMSDSTHKQFDEDPNTKHAANTMGLEGVATGGMIGTAVGATAAAIAAIGTAVLVPGLGIIVAGPILAALAGGGAGAVTGGLIGGLVGLGIPESNAKAYEAALKNGGVVVGVTTRDSKDLSKIREKFEELRGENVVMVIHPSTSDSLPRRHRCPGIGPVAVSLGPLENAHPIPVRVAQSRPPIPLVTRPGGVFQRDPFPAEFPHPGVEVRDLEREQHAAVRGRPPLQREPRPPGGEQRERIRPVTHHLPQPQHLSIPIDGGVEVADGQFDEEEGRGHGWHSPASPPT